MVDAAVAVARGGVGGARPDEARTPSGSARCALPDGIETTSRRGSCEKLLLLQGSPPGEWAGARALGGGRGHCEAGGHRWRVSEHDPDAQHPVRVPQRRQQQQEAASWDEQQLQEAVTLASGGVVQVRAHRRTQLDEYVLIEPEIIHYRRRTIEYDQFLSHSIIHNKLKMMLHSRRIVLEEDMGEQVLRAGGVENGLEVAESIAARRLDGGGGGGGGANMATLQPTLQTGLKPLERRLDHEGQDASMGGSGAGADKGDANELV